MPHDKEDVASANRSASAGLAVLILYSLKSSQRRSSSVLKFHTSLTCKKAVQPPFYRGF